MKKSHRILLLTLATLLFLLPALVACSSGNTEIFYCNVFEDDFRFLSIEEAPKGQANYRGERTYDKDGVLVSCLIREKYTNIFAYELTYNPDGTIATVLYQNSYTIEYKYNEKGLCIAFNEYRFEYDAEGRCIKRYTYAEKDINYSTYSYNENGQLCEIAQYKNAVKKFSTVLLYDQNGNITEKYGQHHLSEEEANRPNTRYNTQKWVYEYQNGKLAKTTVTSTTRTVDEISEKVIEIHEYDENGNEIKFIDYSPYPVYTIDEIGECINYYEYQYDDKGNRIKESVYAVHEEKGFRKLMEEYVIEYDQNSNPTSIAFSSEGTPSFKLEYQFAKDDICTKSVITHSSENVVWEHNGYVTLDDLGDLYWIAARDQQGQVVKELYVYKDSGELFEGFEYMYDDNGKQIKVTYTVAPGYSIVREENKNSVYTPDGQLILTCIFNQNDAENVTVYNSQNDVIFEAEGKWSEFSSANFYSEEVLQYCIYNNSSSRQYGVFIYENGVLRVETEW